MKETRQSPPVTSGNAPISITTSTIGEAWIDVARRILSIGSIAEYDGMATRELVMTTLHVADPRSDDAFIKRLADPERLEWMHVNFTTPARVAALGDADSYATRLYDYDHRGLNQIEWVIERLVKDPTSRSATITTFQPLTDTSYIPCVSLLDFFLQNQRLELVVYAHSIDFGTKGFANLVELAYLQDRVAKAISSGLGPLTMIVKSAHVYESDVESMNGILALAVEGR